MLAEALLYARARLAGQRNSHGHLTELVAIWARHRRQRQAWAEHLARSRALCLTAAEACPQAKRRTALVLGAGLLLDVPLEALARLFRHVVLADMAFLPGTKRLAKALGNVELITTDLTGCLERPGAQVQAPDLSLGLQDLDFVHSANILSQLPISPLAALRGRHPRLCEQDLLACGAAVVRAHLEGLVRLDCPVCLVTDTRELGLADGQPEYEADLLFGVEPPAGGDTWTWRLAPRGEEHPDLDVERLVLGVGNLHAGLGGPAAAGGNHA